MNDASQVFFLPLYQQIKQNLTERLAAGEWSAGRSLPSEIEFAKNYQVSQGTVRKAIDELVAENVLFRRQGKGTFVNSHRTPQAEYRFLRLVNDQGELVPLSSHFQQIQRIRAPSEIAQQLDLRTNDAVIEIVRTQHFGTTPINYESIWLRAAAFKGFSAQSLQAYQGPLYGFFEHQCAVVMVRAEEQIRAMAASDELAQALNVVPATPLLRIVRRSFTYGEKVVELRYSHFLTDNFHYQHQLN